jgi:hypothetical protein
MKGDTPEKWNSNCRVIRRNRELQSKRPNYQTPKTKNADKLKQHGEALQNGTAANLGS